MLNFINCVWLIEELCQIGVIQEDPQVKDHILVYRDIGYPPEQFPEGWYSENIMTMASELRDDPVGQKLLMDKVAEVTGRPFTQRNLI